MNAQRDRATLHQHVAPHLHPENFVYCTFSDFRIPPGLNPICTFREAEGITAIVEKVQAERCGSPYLFESHLITLKVHSSLEAVGLLATLARHLADADIPCNVVAGYHHDHLFVPTGQAELALNLLSSICVSAPAGATPANPPVDQLKMKSAASPANRRGS